MSNNLAKPIIDPDDQKAILVANIDGDAVAGFPVSTLDTQTSRDAAYAALAAEGLADPVATKAETATILAGFSFYERYIGAPPNVALAAAAALDNIESKVAVNQALDLGLDALSLASIYFLAAIGLAITFGVMGVINMAHGEFIMMGAYTGYVAVSYTHLTLPTILLV